MFSSSSYCPPLEIDEVLSHPRPFQPPPRAPRRRTAPAILRASHHHLELCPHPVYLTDPFASHLDPSFDPSLMSTTGEGGPLRTANLSELLCFPLPQSRYSPHRLALDTLPTSPSHRPPPDSSWHRRSVPWGFPLPCCAHGPPAQP
jgi:hypothetical protein